AAAQAPEPKRAPSAAPAPTPSPEKMNHPERPVFDRLAASPPGTAPQAHPVAPAAHQAAGLNGAHPLGADETAQVMLRFQDLMARFLETQKAVMVTYLHGGVGAVPLPPEEALPLPALRPTPALAAEAPRDGAPAPYLNGHAAPARQAETDPA